MGEINTLQIKKRNNKIVEYDGSKVILAIKKAMAETEKGTYIDIAEAIEDNIYDLIAEGEEILSVEFIQDEIEKLLASYGRFDVSKTYILYRNERTKERLNTEINTKSKQKYTLLSEDFLSKYKHDINPFPTIMSEFTYLRTYSRFLPKKNRREYWWETVARVTEYNCTLAPTSMAEAEKIYDNIFNLRQFPSGRSLWVGGTEVSKKYPMSNYNCAYKTLDTVNAFHEGFYLLLIGAGMGFRVLPSDVEKIPRMRNDIKVIHKYYEGIPMKNRKEFTEFTFENTGIAKIEISDSKEGWVKALQLFLELHYNSMYRDINTIEINYDNIRPKGERLKTFGGYASGYQSMQIMLAKIEKVIINSKKKFNNYTKLSSLDCTDMANIIGENVVSGGVRRTAEIILFDKDDKEILEAKTNLYTLENGKWIVNKDIIHRQMSNNSIIYNIKPSREQLHWQIEQMRYTGEPAFVNGESANKRRPNFNGVNACSEILLDSDGMCNLTEIVPLRFIKDGKLDIDGLYEAQRLSARIGYRMTLVDFELSDWDFVNKRDRLLGCSITGWQDFVNELNMSKQDQALFLIDLKKIAIESAKEIANELGLNESVLHTTGKPSGTISILPAVSSGVHYSHSPYYIRRVRISANDPLSFAMEDMGFEWKPEVGQLKDSCMTKVFEFPMKSPKGKTKYDVSAIEQLENYKMFMENYADHNISITVTVKDNEWKEVEEWMWGNWDEVVAVSFLPLTDAMYDLMPYEEISESEYDKMTNDLPKFNPSVLQKYEKGDDFEIEESECENGICPIR